MSDELPTIVIDTRERDPFNYKRGKSVAGVVVEKLDHGDYSIKGYEHLISIERKASVDELSGNLGKNRARFMREMERMQSARRGYIVVEDHWSSIFKRGYSRMHPNALFESIMALSVKYGVSVIFAGTRKQAHKITRSLLLKAFKYREELDDGGADREDS